MALIQVLKVPTSAIDPNRPINGLLRAQLVHLREAERMLPVKYQSDTYVNAITTESEAAEYIGAVTEAIHKAHRVAAARRLRKVGRQGGKIAMAAAAEELKTKTQGTAQVRKRKRRK
jgi:hypothetical protein